MRILLLHSDKFSYEVTGDTSITKLLKPITDDMKKGSIDEALICMIAVEEGDKDKLPKLAEIFVSDVKGHCEKLNTKNVMLYPYAHLSASLESPRSATKVFDSIYDLMSGIDGYNVIRAPFGVYKSFDIKVKGHPLSELGRTIDIKVDEDSKESKALKSEEEKKSEWLVITPDGVEHKAEDFNFSKYPSLKTLFAYEQGGSRVSDTPPPHIKLMQEHELVDYEPASDHGNFRWYPKGYTIKNLLEEQVSSTLQEYGAMRVETPIMYDLEHPALEKYLNKFPARQYRISSDKKTYFLRFAACFGQYMIKHDMSISYKNLPLKLYELTHYSFRREQSGELAGLRRLRTFTMPDMHTLCADVTQAKEEMLSQVDLCFNWMDELDYKKEEYAVALRAVKDFYKANPNYAKEIARKAGQPVLVELWDKRYFYFVTKFEVNYNDTQDKSCALCTVQIDVENPEGFGIKYTDADNNEKFPLMLHTSVSGSIDRNVFALLEKQAGLMKRGEKASYPFWLAPIQARIIPVTEEFNDKCFELLNKLKCRIDFDDTNERMNKKIRNAEKEWVPLIILVGEKEIECGEYTIRVRGSKEQLKLSLEDLQKYIDKNIEGKVYKPINLPKLLSKRGIFRG